MLTVDQLIEAFDHHAHEPGRRTPCGFERLDDLTGGFIRGQVWILTGMPGHGRTTLVTQWAAQLATQGWPTRLICPREPRDFIAARLLSCAGRVPLLQVHQRRVEDLDRLNAAQTALSGVPLHIATQGQSTFLDYDGVPDSLPPASAVVLDDADLVAGASPERVRSFAKQDALVIVTLPRHALVHGARNEQYLDPAWARVADVVVEVRQAQWPETDDNPRPGEADLDVLRNRWGPTMTTSVAFQGHYSRFVDMKR